MKITTYRVYTQEYPLNRGVKVVHDNEEHYMITTSAVNKNTTENVEASFVKINDPAAV